MSEPPNDLNFELNLDPLFFPMLKRLPGNRIAYLSLLTFDRFRLNVTSECDPWGIDDFW